MKLIWIMVAVMAVSGCSMGQDMQVTDAAVAQFHKQLDAGQFAAITASSGPEMKSVDAAPFLTAMRGKLGAFKSSSRQGFNDNYNNGDHTLTAIYASVYANGPATETFVYRFIGGKPLLVGYNVNSPVLLK